MNPPESTDESIIYRPIGVVHSPHTQPEATPIQPNYAQGIQGHARILPEFVAGLRDLDGFSHLLLIYHLHRAGSAQLEVVPFMDVVERGLFATCAPRRPNPIGLSVVRLLRVENDRLDLEDLDILDGTPLLDIKPYVPRFLTREGVRGGWTEQIDAETARRRGRRQYRDPGGSGPEPAR